ncbi:hypothetical protein M3795_25065 [Ralstonia pickettii]|uniref:hypothetical protein n=1 Tax=Ralstonia pickettii TaxID=329 RepID=UPI00203AE1CD|nr:hypothetical protein [Ralstonia pickettii]MCM3583744.1 hypothetical protein [Ralstonia pickettii]
MKTKLTSKELASLRDEEHGCLSRVTSIHRKLNGGSTAVTRDDLVHWQTELIKVQAKLLAAGELPQSAETQHKQMFECTADVGTTVYRDIVGDEAGRFEVDLKTVVDAKFAASEGVLTFSKDTPDAMIVLLIKQALAAGKPFTVVPA